MEFFSAHEESKSKNLPKNVFKIAESTIVIADGQKYLYQESPILIVPVSDCFKNLKKLRIFKNHRKKINFDDEFYKLTNSKGFADRVDVANSVMAVTTRYKLQNQQKTARPAYKTRFSLSGPKIHKRQTHSNWRYKCCMSSDDEDMPLSEIKRNLTKKCKTATERNLQKKTTNLIQKTEGGDYDSCEPVIIYRHPERRFRNIKNVIRFRIPIDRNASGNGLNNTVEYFSAKDYVSSITNVVHSSLQNESFSDRFVEEWLSFIEAPLQQLLQDTNSLGADKNDMSAQQIEMYDINHYTHFPPPPTHVFGPPNIPLEPLNLSKKKYDNETQDMNRPIDLSIGKRSRERLTLILQKLVKNYKHVTVSTHLSTSNGRDCIDNKYRVHDMSFYNIETSGVVSSSLNNVIEDELIETTNRQLIMKLFDNPCLQYFRGKCPNCDHNQMLPSEDVIAMRFSYQPIELIDEAYSMIVKVDTMFNKYFSTFCNIYGYQGMINRLVDLIKDSFDHKNDLIFYLKCIMNGLMLCQLSKSRSFKLVYSELLQRKEFLCIIQLLIHYGLVIECMDELKVVLGGLMYNVPRDIVHTLLEMAIITKNADLNNIMLNVVKNCNYK